MPESLEQIECERTERKEALAKARLAQRAIDIGALNALEIERGDGNVASLDVGRYAPGLVTLLVVRPLTRPELKRYRDRIRAENADNAAAAEEAAASTLLYPARDSEQWSQLTEAIPGIAARAGVEAVQLSVGLERASGK